MDSNSDSSLPDQQQQDHDKMSDSSASPVPAADDFTNDASTTATSPVNIGAHNEYDAQGTTTIRDRIVLTSPTHRRHQVARSRTFDSLVVVDITNSHEIPTVEAQLNDDSLATASKKQQYFQSSDNLAIQSIASNDPLLPTMRRSSFDAPRSGDEDKYRSLDPERSLFSLKTGLKKAGKYDYFGPFRTPRKPSSPQNTTTNNNNKQVLQEDASPTTTATTAAPQKGGGASSRLLPLLTRARANSKKDKLATPPTSTEPALSPRLIGKTNNSSTGSNDKKTDNNSSSSSSSNNNNNKPKRRIKITTEVSKTLFGGSITTTTHDGGEEDDIVIYKAMTPRERLEWLLKKTLFGKILDVVTFLFTIAAIALYIYTTYAVYAVCTQQDIKCYPLWIIILEGCFAVDFAADYILRLIAAGSAVRFFFDVRNIIDLISIIPSFALVYRYTQLRFMQHFWQDITVIRVNRVFSIVRFFKLYRFAALGEGMVQNDALRKIILELAVAIVSTIIATSAIIQFVESELAGYTPSQLNEPEAPKMWRFHDAFYMICITITTVGYGDFTPQTTLGKFTIIILIFCTLAYIPIQSSKLYELIRLSSSTEISAYKLVSSFKHVVVTGDCSYPTIKAFLKEFYHPAHENYDTHVVILSEKNPSKMLQLHLNKREYLHKVFYLKGSALVDTDLKRAKIVKARACFVLADKKHPNPEQKDAENILRTFSIRNYSVPIRSSLMHKVKKTLKKHNLWKKFKALPDKLKLNRQIKELIVPHKLKIYAQVLLAANKGHMRAAGADFIISTSELKMRILGKSCICRGFSTFFVNMFSNEGYVYTKKKSWLSEYTYGTQFEIYLTDISSDMHGMSFSEAATLIYKTNACFLFGLKRKVGKKTEIMLNPQQLIIQKGDIGCVFAKNAKEARMIATMKVSPFFSVPMDDASTDSTPLNTKEIELKQQNQKPAMAQQNTADTSLLVNNETMIIDNNDTSDQSNGAVNYFMLNKNLPTLEECTLKSVGDKVGHHIIITGSMEHLEHLMLPLRSKVLRTQKPVVLLSKEPPSSARWDILGMFPNLYYVRGDPHSPEDLARAGIATADIWIILPSRDSRFQTEDIDEHEAHEASTTFNKYLADYDNLLCCIHQQTTCKDLKIFTILELVNGSNGRFLLPRSHIEINDLNEIIIPVFAAGRMISDSFMDSMLCQAYYNGNILTILEEFINSRSSYLFLIDCPTIDGGSSEAASPFVPTTTTSTTTIASASAASSPSSDLSTSLLPQKRSLQYATFGALFEGLLSRNGWLAIGIFRSEESWRERGDPHAKLPFVYACPPPQTKLHPCDKIYIIRSITTTATTAPTTTTPSTTTTTTPPTSFT